jgi:hypothetical protein
VQPVVRRLDAILDQALGGQDPTEPFEVTLAFALDLLRSVEPTLILQNDMGYEFDWAAARSALEYMSGLARNLNNRGKVYCLLRKDRNISRFQPALGPPYFSDAPDTAQREGAIARRVAIDMPILIMIRQNGAEEQGWKGTPFYWPVIMAQQNVPVSIFAHETTP